MVVFRVVFIVLTILFGILFIVYFVIAKSKWTGEKGIDTKNRWCPKFGGFDEYELSARFEITFFAFFLAFIMTLQYEFCQHFLMNRAEGDKASAEMLHDNGKEVEDHDTRSDC